LGGAILGGVLLTRWPETARIPQARMLAAGTAIIGGVLFAASAAAAIAHYPTYASAVIPPSELPKTAADIRAHAAALAASYPDDPRSHLYLSQVLVDAKDYAGAERELRLALADAQAIRQCLGLDLSSLSEVCWPRCLPINTSWKKAKTWPAQRARYRLAIRT
jgi:hypothetical protein